MASRRPCGIAFPATAFSEVTLIKLAYFEQAIKWQKAPQWL